MYVSWKASGIVCLNNPKMIDNRQTDSMTSRVALPLNNRSTDPSIYYLVYLKIKLKLTFSQNY